MNKNARKYFPFLCLLLGVAATAMVFLPALKYPDAEKTYTGIQLITGLTIFDVGVIADGKLPFNVLALLAFALPATAGLVALARGNSFGVAFIMFVASTVLLFLLPKYIHINVTTFISGTTEQDTNWVLQTGAIIAGALSIVGALISILGFTKVTK